MSIATFTLKSATTNAAAPFSIGHAFKSGDVPAGSQLISGLSDMQVTAKNAWPDGSLKFAVISGRASLVANTPLSVVLSIGTPAGGTALTTTDLKATGITAAIDAGGFGSVSWATTDWDAPLQAWISGPKMSSWIYRKPVGSDPHLVAWLEVRLWSGGEVNVLPWIENGYFKVAGPTNKSDTFGFTLGGTSRFSLAINLLHHQRTVLINGTMLSYWLGAEPGVTPLVDPAYMMSTELVPTYSAVMAAGAARVTVQVSTFVPLQAGNFTYDSDAMTSSGYQSPIGLLPEHDVVYLVANAADRPALYGSVVRNGYASGRWCIHFRDETTQRPPAFSTYPTTVLTGGQEMGIKDIGGSTNGQYTPVPTGGNATKWDASHSPSIGYMAYLLTGRFYFKEEVQFATTANHFTVTDWVRGGGTGQYDYSPRAGFTGASGICNSVTQTRAGAWRFRTLAQALAITPDSGDPLRSELIASVEANCEYFHQIYVAQTNNPFGIIESAGTEVYTDIATDRLMVPIWQHDFGTAAWGWALALDLPISSTKKAKMVAFFAWKAKSVIHRLGTTGGYRFERAGVYEYAASSSTLPNFQSGTGPWYADDAAAYAATSVNYQNVTPTANALYYNTTDYGPPERSLFGNLSPAIAYAARHGVTGAVAAYARMTGASNYSTLATGFNSSPVWSVAPASASSPPAPVGIGKVTRVDTTDYISGVTVCGDAGFGVLASEIPTGFANPSMLANDVDGADPANTVYRVQILTGPSVGTLVVNEDGSATYTPPSGGYVGVATGTQRIWKNNEAAYDTTYSFTSGTTGVTINLTGANLSQSSTVSAGAVTVAHTVNLAGANLSQSSTLSSGAVTVTPPAPPAPAPRFARPASDVTAGAWLPSSGSSLYAMIDEPSADSSDFIYTTTPASPAEVKLNAVQDPNTSSGQVVRYQAWSLSGTGMIVRLKQGSTIIAAWNHATLPTSPTIHVQILSPSECDSITDYTDLRFEFLAV